MARCNRGDSCTCAIAGDGTTTVVTGNGSVDNPYVVSAPGGVGGDPFYVILTSPDSTLWKVGVSNAGAITIVAV